MEQMIHFEENLQFLSKLNAMLKNAWSMQIDPEYYASWIIDQLFFIQNRMQMIHSALSQSIFLIHKQKLWKNLLQIKQEYIQVLRYLLEQTSLLSDSLKPYLGKIKLTLSQESQELEIWEKELNNDNAEILSEAVSCAEFELLFQPDEEPVHY